jgi:FkbM family methyltransferase
MHEPATVEALQVVLHDGATFVDLGSNEGYFSIIASTLVGSTGHVYAIEPQRRLQWILQKNIEFNRAYNVMVRKCAISDHVGTGSLYLSPNTNTGSSGFYRATRYQNRIESVETETLSNFFSREEIDSCDLLKVDIEGHEFEAILGSPDIFRAGAIKAVALEVHHAILRRRGLQAEEISRFLVSCGYHLDDRFPEFSMWVRRD